MGSSQPPPMDEIMWSSPAMAQQMGGIHTNTVLPYFAESDFYDKQSNNANVTLQALNNQNMFYLIQTREAFEGRLRTMQGVEFMVTHDPSEGDKKHDHNGVWVIRKQNRRRRPGMSDEITPMSSYYIVGINIYMAPSVGNIVGSRLLSSVTSLTKLLSTASSLPIFTPAVGHTYLPQTSKDTTPSTSFQATQSSKEGTPMPGTSTPLPATQDTSTSSKTASQSKSNTDYQGVQMLADSYSLLQRYGNEYMDENPIVGEPGSFRLTKSHDSTLTSSMSTNKSSQPLKVATPAQSPIPAPVKEVPPPQLKTENLPAPVKKATKGGEKSPTTPGFKEKKDKRERRKSKALGANDMTTPKATTPKTTTPT